MASQEKINRSLAYALDRVNMDTCFVFHKVKPEFYPGGQFSKVQLELVAHSSKGHQLTLEFNDLFRIDSMAPEFNEAKRFIHTCRGIKWPPLLWDFKSEK